jgi:hypothetical protein
MSAHSEVFALFRSAKQSLLDSSGDLVSPACRMAVMKVRERPVLGLAESAVMNDGRLLGSEANLAALPFMSAKGHFRTSAGAAAMSACPQ